MKKFLLTLSAVLCLIAYANLAVGQDWVEIKDDKFGLRMLVPSMMKLAAKDFGKGWGGLYGALKPVEMSVVAQLGNFPADTDMEAFAVIVTEIPANAWTLVDKGENQGGWKWWKTYHATDGKLSVFAVLGHGPKGSYIVFLKTTNADLQANQAAYAKWYANIVLY